MKGLMFGLAVSFVLSACSSLPKIEDVAGSTTAAGVTAGLVTLSVNPAAAIVTGAAAGAAVEVAIPDEESVDITQVENEHQAEVAIQQIEAEWWQNFTLQLIAAAVVLTIVAWILPGPQVLFRRKNHAQSSNTDPRPARSRYHKRYPRS